MISKEAIKRGYNRGNYIVGAHTPPAYAATLKDTVRDSTAEAGLQRDPVEVSGSSQRLGASDGDYYDWTLTWAQWQAPERTRHPWISQLRLP